MPMERYNGLYIDTHGCEPIVLENDGDLLRTTINGVVFEDTAFDGLTVQGNPTKEQLARFTLNHHELCGCAIHFSVPIETVIEKTASLASLSIAVHLGQPNPRNGGIDSLGIQLTLISKHGLFTGASHNDNIETALLALQNKLPKEMYLKVCFNCLYSDYSPYGSGMFGSLMCFKDIKKTYLELANKPDPKSALLGILDKHETVQETHVCKQFKQRPPDTGYRG